MSSIEFSVKALMLRNLDEVFNERDPDRRAAAIEEVYGAEPVFYEQDNVVEGREALNARVQALLDDAPGFVFSADGEGTENHGMGRLTWHLGPPGAPPVVTGTDIAMTGDGAIQALYTFIEEKNTMATEAAVGSNIEIVREYTEKVFNAHDPELAAEYVTPDVRWHGGTLGTVEGVEGLVGLLRGFIGALPDLNAEEQDIVADGDTVAVRFVVEATHQGDLLGIPPTGRRVRWDAVDVYRLRDGKISEEWAADDLTAILHQVEAYTPPWLS